VLLREAMGWEESWRPRRRLSVAAASDSRAGLAGPKFKAGVTRLIFIAALTEPTFGRGNDTGIAREFGFTGRRLHVSVSDCTAIRTKCDREAVNFLCDREAVDAPGGWASD